MGAVHAVQSTVKKAGQVVAGGQTAAKRWPARHVAYPPSSHSASLHKPTPAPPQPMPTVPDRPSHTRPRLPHPSNHSTATAPPQRRHSTATALAPTLTDSPSMRSLRRTLRSWASKHSNSWSPSFLAAGRQRGTGRRAVAASGAAGMADVGGQAGEPRRGQGRARHWPWADVQAGMAGPRGKLQAHSRLPLWFSRLNSSTFLNTLSSTCRKKERKNKGRQGGGRLSQQAGGQLAEQPPPQAAPGTSSPHTPGLNSWYTAIWPAAT